MKPSRFATILVLTILLAWVDAKSQLSQEPVSSAHANIELIFNAMTAFGTLGAAILALFGDRIRSWLSRPVLNFRVDPKISPLVEQLELDDENSSGGKKKYCEIRVEVANSGKDAARNCRARVNAIYKQKSTTNDFFPVKEFVPRYLYWAKKDTKSEESLDVLPKLPEYVVVGRLTEQETPITGGQQLSTVTRPTVFGLEVAVEPEGVKGRFCFIDEGKVVLPFLLYADNLRSYEQKYVEMFWDGKSIDDFGPEHFGVKLLSKSEGDAIIGRPR